MVHATKEEFETRINKLKAQHAETDWNNFVHVYPRLKEEYKRLEDATTPEAIKHALDKALPVYKAVHAYHKRFHIMNDQVRELSKCKTSMGVLKARLHYLENCKVFCSLYKQKLLDS